MVLAGKLFTKGSTEQVGFKPRLEDWGCVPNTDQRGLCMKLPRLVFGHLTLVHTWAPKQLLHLTIHAKLAEQVDLDPKNKSSSVKKKNLWCPIGALSLLMVAAMDMQILHNAFLA